MQVPYLDLGELMAGVQIRVRREGSGPAYVELLDAANFELLAEAQQHTHYGGPLMDVWDFSIPYTGHWYIAAAGPDGRLVIEQLTPPDPTLFDSQQRSQPTALGMPAIGSGWSPTDAQPVQFQSGHVPDGIATAIGGPMGTGPAASPMDFGGPLPRLPAPADPVDPLLPDQMTQPELVEAWEQLRAEWANYRSRCTVRPFILPTENAAYSACWETKGLLDARQAILTARAAQLGIEIVPEGTLIPSNAENSPSPSLPATEPPSPSQPSPPELTYVPSPKHNPSMPSSGRKGTRMDLSDEEAQALLQQSIAVGKKRYAFKDGKVYVFQPDNRGGFHGYPAAGKELQGIPKKLRDAGKIDDKTMQDLLAQGPESMPR